MNRNELVWLEMTGKDSRWAWMELCRRKKQEDQRVRESPEINREQQRVMLLFQEGWKQTKR